MTDKLISRNQHIGRDRFNLAVIKKKSTKHLSLIDYLSLRQRINHYSNNENLIDISRNHLPFLNRLNLMKKLPVHDGCVNTICWNKTGEYILSGSDDCNLCITKPTYMFDQSKDYTVLHKVRTHHLGNIFSAKFMPNSQDHQLVSCSSEGPVIVHDIDTTDPSEGLFSFNCHTSAICEVVPIEDEDKVFLTCSEDKTIRLFDLRCHRSCSRASTCPHPSLIRNSYAMTTLCLNPLNSNLILTGRADGLGLVYDRRKLPDPSKFSREQAHLEYLESGSGSTNSSFKYMHPLDGVVSQFTVPDMEGKLRFTSLCYSADGQQVLASYSQDYIYLFNHDRSSNVELIQTLPKKSAIERNNEGNATSERLSANESTNNQRGSQNSRSPAIRTPRIRVRGDWTDTGINSVPYSDRSNDDISSSQRATNILQRMTEVAFHLNNTRRSATATRLIPVSEVIAGPLEYSPNESRLQDEESHDEEDNDDDDDDDETNEDEEMDDENGPEESEESDDSHDHNDEATESEERRDFLATFASAYRSERVANGHIERPSKAEQPKKSKISQQIKMKFSKTLEELKNKFNKIPTRHPHVKYQGHRNSRTSYKEARFWGDDYIMSGSDCGRIMVWEKKTAKLLMAFPADERVVNCLAPNPHFYLLASSGIDYDVKLWSTQSFLEDPLKIGEKEMEEIVKKNELMLEEAKNTITVPPHLLFRVLASLAHNRLS